jgi:hypothetical protein
LRGANEHIHHDDIGDGVGDAVLSWVQTDRHQIRPESSETAHGKNQPQEDQMRVTVLIVLGWMLSNCAAVKMITGHSIQAKDVISTVNTVNNLHKYSEPAAREELENRIRQITRSRQAGGETQ